MEWERRAITRLPQTYSVNIKVHIDNRESNPTHIEQGCFFVHSGGLP